MILRNKYIIKRPIEIINTMDSAKYIYEDLIKSICHEYRIVKANSEEKPRIIPVIHSLIIRFLVLLSTIFSSLKFRTVIQRLSL
ncbi:hypothetical protein NRIC0776_11760 [Apilactobacillus kunkeei]